LDLVNIDFIKKLSQWNTANTDSGTTLWRQITAGYCTVMLQTQCNKEKKNHILNYWFQY